MHFRSTSYCAITLFTLGAATWNGGESSGEPSEEEEEEEELLPGSAPDSFCGVLPWRSQMWGLGRPHSGFPRGSPAGFVLLPTHA